MTLIRKIYRLIADISDRTSRDSVNAVSGHATLFIVISFFPFVMLLLASVKYMPFSKQQVIDLFDFVSPGALSDTIHEAINEVYTRSGSFALSITGISLLWSASTSIYTITLGLNRVYKHTETRNYFILRGLSLFYTFIFIISIIVALLMMVFGRSILNFLESIYPLFSKFDILFDYGRKIIAFVVILLIFALLYTVIPNRPSRIDFEIPGALFSALGWYLFSFFYSVYIENFSNVSYIYGSITAVVLLVIWLYICLYMFFIGAELNQICAEKGWRRRQRSKFYEKKSMKQNARKQKANAIKERVTGK